jgi:hypothetical protein
MAKAPVLATGFLQLLIVDTLGDQFSMWFSKLPQISDAEYFFDQVVTPLMLWNLFKSYENRPAPSLAFKNSFCAFTS